MPGCLPGSVHDLTAARIRGLPRHLRAAGLLVLADKGYQGMGEAKVPYRGRGKPGSQKDANRSHARLRGPGERANTRLKSWHVLDKLRCCPHRAGRLAKAILKRLIAKDPQSLDAFFTEAELAKGSDHHPDTAIDQAMDLFTDLETVEMRARRIAEHLTLHHCRSGTVTQPSPTPSARPGSAVTGASLTAPCRPAWASPRSSNAPSRRILNRPKKCN